MILKLENYFFNKMTSTRKSHPIYIVPTSDGIKVGFLNLLLLIIGLVYANNYVLLFNFMLFCLLVSSMFYTHFNLNKLKLKHADIPALYAREPVTAKLTFIPAQHGHYFLSADPRTIKLFLLSKETFSLTTAQPIAHLNLIAQARGKVEVSNLYIESRFPFNFFRCFTFYSINQVVYVYPTRTNLNCHVEYTVEDQGNREAEDFNLKNFVPGDSPKRIDWKKYAQTTRMFSKHQNHIRHQPIMLKLSKEKEIESQLESICFAIHVYHNSAVKYGLDLEGHALIHPDHSVLHMTRCLETLARYEA